MPGVIPPTPDADDGFFWDGVAAGRLLLRKCAACGHMQHPPTPMCRECHATEWTVHESSGHGIVLSSIISRHPSQPDEGRVVVLVELDEGVRIVSNYPGDGSVLPPANQPVEVLFETIDGVDLPQFRDRRT
jgi:uncharacterized OB-fold protein